jgi:hypothetical protein
MRHVISAPATLDVSAHATRIAPGTLLVPDPTRELCKRYGYRTLYEMPRKLQKRLRRELVREHAEALFENADCVCDHSVFAFLADWMRWLWSETPAEEWEGVLVDAYPAVQRSEQIHHVVAAPRAGRGYDADSAKQLDKLMRNLYRDFGCEARVIDISIGP